MERGRFNQRLLRRAYYPLKLRAPLRDAVVFVSWKGKQCADNPLGIAAELRNRGDDREHIWVVTDPAVRAPEGATVVLRGSHEYYETLARSRFLISNDDMPAHYRKRDGQIYLQTWHGTPLKRIGFDIERPRFISGAAYLDHLAERGAALGSAAVTEPVQHADPAPRLPVRRGDLRVRVSPQ